MSNKIKMLIMDVDGTLTDGKIYISQAGELFKAFNVKDGLGIVKARRENIIPVIITGRNSPIVENRAKELGIEEVYQGVSDKSEQTKSLLKKYSLLFDEVACMGDDENDIPIMKLCGLCGCPADAMQVVKNQCDYITQKNGGDGAVREFVEWILNR